MPNIEKFKKWLHAGNYYNMPPRAFKLLEDAGYSPAEFEPIMRDYEDGLKAYEKEYCDQELPKIKKSHWEWLQEFRKTDEWRETRMLFLAERVKETETMLFDFYKWYMRGFKTDIPFWLRSMPLEKIKKLEKKLRNHKFELRLIENKKELSPQITPEMILRAREFPFDELIEVKKNFALCPFHVEKHASFYVKNNFYYCFGACQMGGDTIDYIMKKENLNFVEAVKRLL